MYRVIFLFHKENGGEFISHLSQVEMFNRAFLKSRLPVIYTTGFNPLPRLEFASTMSLGITSQAEIASTVLYENIFEEDFISSLNKHLPLSLQLKKAFIFPVTNQRRRESLSTGLWGNEYIYTFKCRPQEIKEFFQSAQAKEFTDKASLCDFKISESNGQELYAKLLFQKDRPFRNALEDYFQKKIWDIASIHKIQTLAKPDIVGWTDDINQAYQKSLEGMKSHSEMYEINARFRSQVITAEKNMENADSRAISFFELYKKIALVNEKLIKQRKALEEKKAGKL